MSLGPNQTFESELEHRLLEAGLPDSPAKVIGRQYRFGCEHGSHHHILVGTIQAIEVSDESGLALQVSNRELWGGPLVAIQYISDRHGWALRAERGSNPSDLQWFEGAFKLL